jgi:hypothetical protein
MAGDMRRSGSQWRATGGAPVGGLAPPGAVNLPRPSRGALAVTAQRLMVALAPRCARPTRVRRVRRLADVVTLDVAAERAPVFPGKFQFADTVFKHVFL